MPLPPHLRAAFILYNIFLPFATVFALFFDVFGESVGKILSKLREESYFYSEYVDNFLGKGYNKYNNVEEKKGD